MTGGRMTLMDLVETEADARFVRERWPSLPKG